MKNKRSQLISVINTPLGFFVLALLIVEAFLATVLIGANFDSATKVIGMWLGVGLFCLVTFAVFALVWHKPENLTFDKEAHLLDRGVVYGTESNVITNVEFISSDRTNPSDINK